MSIMDDKRVEEYLRNICKLVKNKRVHNEITEEISCHIEEIVGDYIEIGVNKDEAVDKALAQLGSSETVGKELNIVHKATPDFGLLAMTAAMLLIGILLLAQIESNFHPYLSRYSSADFLGKTIVFSVIGIVLAMIIVKIDYRYIQKYSVYIFGASIALLLVNFINPTYVNGLRGYLAFGPISININYITSLLLIISLAGIFSNYNWSKGKNIILGIIITVVPGILLLGGNSLALLLVYFIGVFTVMLMSEIKARYVIGSFITLGTVVFAFVINQPYRIERLFMFLKPDKDPLGSGWIYNRLSELRNSAGAIGSSSNFDPTMLPDFYSSYMLTYITYNFGWVVTIMLIALILAFIIRIGFIGLKVKNSYGKLLVGGLCAFIASQFIINILMNLTLTPSMGINMPFISYGGTSLISNIIIIAIITNVYKWRNTPFEVKKTENC